MQNIVCKLSYHNYDAINCDLLTYLYENEVVDDNFNMIVRDKVRDILKYSCDTNRMEVFLIKMILHSIVSYFVNHKPCPLYLDKPTFQNFPR